MYAVPAAGSGPRYRLHPPLPEDVDIGAFEVSPDGSRVAYTLDGAGGLYSVPVDAGSAPVLLSTGEIMSFAISPDSQWAVFYGYDELGGGNALMCARLDGTTPPVVLESLPSVVFDEVEFWISPDSKTVVYEVGLPPYAVLGEIRSVPLDGSRPPTVLSGSYAFLDHAVISDKQSVVFVSDSQSVVFVRDDYRLCRVSVDGGEPTLALTTLSVYAPPQVARDTLALFVAEQPANEFGLYSVPIDGSESETFLDTATAGLVPCLSPDNARVFYFKGAEWNYSLELWALDLTETPVHPVRLVGNEKRRQVFPNSVRISEDGQLVTLQVNGTLYCVRLSAPGSPLAASAPIVLSEHCVDSAGFDTSCSRVIFTELSDDSRFSLCTAPWDASSPARVLNPGNKRNRMLECKRFGSSGRLLFVTEEVEGFVELFDVAAEGSEAPVRLSGRGVHLAADFDHFDVTADGQTVVYQLTDTDGPYIGYPSSIWSASVDGAAPPVDICYGDSFVCLPDSRRIAISDWGHYLSPSTTRIVSVDGSELEWGGMGSFRGVSLDASKILLEISYYTPDPPPPPDLDKDYYDHYLVVLDTDLWLEGRLGFFDSFPHSCISPDGRFVATGGYSARIQPSDASAPAAEVARGNCVSLEFTPDSSRLVFISDATDSAGNLYVAPVDLKSSPVRLDASGRVARFGIAPNSQRVFWLSVPPEPNTVDSFELHVSPLDAASAPVCLGEEVRTAQFTPNSRRIVYLDAGQLSSFGERGELPVPLSGAEVVTQFALSGDSRYAVYLAQSGEENRLFSVPVDGSGLSICLTPELDKGVTVGSLSDPPFAISGDGLQVSYVLATRVTEDTVAYQLFSVPIHGGLALLRSDPSTQTEGPGKWVHRHLVYTAPAESETAGGLFTSLASGGPGVLVRRADSQPASTIELPAKFDLLFDEPVQSLDPDAVVNAGTAPGVVFTAARQGPGRFELAAVSADGDGTIRPSLMAGSAQNANDESNEETIADLDETVLLDVFVAVPQLAGVTVSEATAILADVDLAVGERTHLHNALVPVGTVISQQPTVGEQVLRGSSVNLVISLGPEQVPVPDLSDKTPDEAEAALSAAGLLLGTVTEAFSDRVPAGKIVSQDPAEYSVVSKNSVVNITVSAGPQPVAVPDVVGLDFAAAEALLTNAVLQVGTVTSQFSADMPVGSVLHQQPAAQVLASPGSKVDLVLSKGPEPGAITVNIEPEEARISGAQWRVDGGPWQDGSGVVSDMLPGTHTIEFKSISAPYGCYALAAKWMTPSNRDVVISSGATTAVSATYVQLIQ